MREKENSLANQLAEVATKLENFAATGDLQERNSFGHGLTGLFEAAVQSPMAVKASLHLIEEAMKIDPEYAWDQFANMSKRAEKHNNIHETLIFPALDRMMTPENLKALEQSRNALDNWSLSSPVMQRVMAKHYKFGPDALTPENEGLFLSLTYEIERGYERFGRLEQWVVPAAQVVLRIAQEPQFSAAGKKNAILMSNGSLATFILALKPDFAETVFKPVATAEILGNKKATPSHITERCKSFAYGLVGNTAFSAVMIDLLNQSCARLEKIKSDDKWQTPQYTIAELTKDIAKSSAKSPALHAAALQHYEAHAMKHLHSASSNSVNDTYESERLSVAMAANYDLDPEGLDDHEALPQTMQVLLDMMDFAAKHREPEFARAIQIQLFERALEYMSLESKIAAFEKINGGTLDKFTPMQLLEELEDNFGEVANELRRTLGHEHKSTELLMHAALSRMDDPAMKLRVLMIYKYHAQNVDYTYVSDAFKAVGDADPEKLVEPYKQLSIGRNMDSIYLTPLGIILTDALEPYLDRLSAKSKQEIAVFMDQYDLKRVLDDERKARIGSFIEAQKPGLDEKHPAFKVDVTRIKAMRLTAA